MEQEKLLKATSAEKLKECFSGTCAELFQSELSNSKVEGPRGQRYTDEIKQFALTVNFYSPKAYGFLRRVFKLPHPSSIRLWTATVNCEPGFLHEVFQDLKFKSIQDPNTSDCCLIIDAMAIRKQTIYDSKQSRYIGFVDYGNLLPEQSETVASEGLVFLLSGIRQGTNWKCPVGYFLTDHLGAESQASLINTCLSLASEFNLRIWSVTCDGTASNISTLQHLGCHFYTNYDLMQVHFQHPTRKDQVVYATPDACHNLKLGRNALGDLGEIKDETGATISFSFIRALSDLQEDEGFNIANKLTSTHVKYYKHKMKVKLAAQTLSSSVADALEFMKDEMKDERFQKLWCYN